MPTGICLAISYCKAYRWQYSVALAKTSYWHGLAAMSLLSLPPKHRGSLEATASRILTRLRQPFRIGLIEIYTGCSIGISLAPQHGQDCESVIRNADTAMYTAKEGGRGQFCVFSPEMNQRVFEYLWLDTNLRKALENDQLVIHYQPKITRRGEVRSPRRRWFAGSLRNVASFHHWNLSPTPKNQGLSFLWVAGLFWTLCVR